MKKILSFFLVLSIAAFFFLSLSEPGYIVPNRAGNKTIPANKVSLQPLAGGTYDPLLDFIYVGRSQQQTDEQAEEATAETTVPKETQPPTEEPTKKAAKKPKEKETQPPSEAATDLQTEAQTEEPTPAEKETDPPVQETPEQLAYKEMLYRQQWDAGYVMAIDNPDPGYWTTQVTLTDEDRYYAQCIVMGEAGTEGFTGCALVAQTLRDAMIFDGYQSVKDIKKGNGYDGWHEQPNIDAINAVTFIFDQNRSAVQHRILYFYGTYITSKWHESQNFVCQWGVSKFYDRW